MTSAGNYRAHTAQQRYFMESVDGAKQRGKEMGSQWLVALHHIASFPDRFGFLAGFAEATVHQSTVTLPPASVFGVLCTCRIRKQFN